MRPCPWIGCRYHLLTELNDITGRLTLHVGKRSGYTDDMALITLRTMPETCALDVADRAKAEGIGITLEEISDMLQLSRERIRQIEDAGLHKLEAEDCALREFAGTRKPKQKHGPEPQPVLASLDWSDD